jgi:YQGE family putative transporter
MGWLIELGKYSGLYSPAMAYWVFSILASIILISSGLIILKTDYKTPRIGKMLQLKISKNWNRIRFINFSAGVLEGLSFYLPTLLVLFYLGEEGVLGTISSVVILFTVVIAYSYGRLAKPHHRRPIFFISLIFYLILASLLFILNHPYNIIVFVLFAGIPTIFQWLTIDPLWLDATDKEINKNNDNRYPLILDREIFLEGGRIISVFALFLFIKLTTKEMGFFLAPLILGITQLILMLFAWRNKTPARGPNQKPELLQYLQKI